jgi:EAL domain-containing protein (putative c-di-GMP-specific phosphodiesterase class I)
MDKLVIEQIFRQMDHLVTRPSHITINVLPASLADSWFDPGPLASRCREAGMSPMDVTVECTEQQSAPDRDALERRVRQLRDAGFGFAVDDAGAGYASFALIAKLRPSLIKIDRDIVQGIAGDDAKQALVEAFVGFARRIDADLAAEGIEYISDFETLRGLGVKLGQGYLLGRPAAEPEQPRLPRPVVAVPAVEPLTHAATAADATRTDGPRLSDTARLAS